MTIRGIMVLGSMAAALGFGVFAGAASAQGDMAAYPTKPIRFVVGFAAGGGTDIIARLVGQRMSEILGKAIIVDNKPGATGIIATEAVKTAPPDGYTLLFGASGTMTSTMAVYPNLTFSTLRDFEPISQVARFPTVILVKQSSPIRSLAELIAFGKEHPEKANVAGTGVTFQIIDELIAMKTGARFQFINYKSGTEAVNAVIGEGVTMSVIDAPAASAFVKSGQVRPLAVTTAQRSDYYPDVPTVAELGIPGLDVSLWSGLFAPAGTSPAIVAKLQQTLAQALADPALRARLRELASEPVGNTPAAFRSLIDAEIAQWIAVARAGNIKAEP